LLAPALEESGFVDAGVHGNIEEPDHHLLPALFSEPDLGLGIRVARIVR
jgi:hypothetical protein